jgi:hypothetical protein
VAIIAHHPQATYFGMKSGFVPEDPAPDALVAEAPRADELPPDTEPDEAGSPEGDAPATTPA